MKVSAIFFLSLLSRANAIGWGSVRGEATEEVSIDLACTLKGGSAQNTCDATKSEDGSTCVWCELASYGVCVSEAIASQMKLQIPGLDCDDDGRTDDDNDDESNDDNAATDDDDVPSTDDNMPDDYWKCIEKYSTAQDCDKAGCAWCNNKGGYGVCFDKETAKSFADSDWYSCDLESFSSLTVEDPTDPTCIAATIGGDESSCKATMDADGKPCDWCSFQAYEFCINVDQAQIAEQYGASCGDRANADPETKTKKVSDPSDPTCPAATIGGDESSCKATMDADGKPCDWCSFQGYDFCADQDQAQIIEQYGASCSSGAQRESKELSDPSDPTCIAATLGGDESSCKATMDADGKPCDWCSFQGYDICADHDQAQIMEQYGASCSDGAQEEKKTFGIQLKELSDPSDPTCVAATLGGDESSCKATIDSDGKPCDWCSFQGYDFCADQDQAQIMEQYGASCSNTNKLSDPSDPTCVAATLGGDESSCKATMDADGKPCEWCSFQGYNFCADHDQTQIIEQYGASCGDRKGKNASTSVA